MALCRMLFCILLNRQRAVKQTPKKTMFFRVPIRVPTRVPIRVPGQAQTVCLCFASPRYPESLGPWGGKLSR